MRCNCERGGSLGVPNPKFAPMPSLLRFLTIVAVIGGIGYGALYALANFVTPKPREMTVTIQPDKFQKR